MLAHPLADDDINSLDVSKYQAEWKWDGARVQLVSAEDGIRLFSRSGDDISASFPEIVAPLAWQGVLDGELLAGSPDALGSFQQLQMRLNRKRPSAKLQTETPVFIRCYDLLFNGDTDVRGLSLSQRRSVLEGLWRDNFNLPYLDLSEVLADANIDKLQQWRNQCRSGGLVEGLMLKDKKQPLPRWQGRRRLV